MSTNVASFKDYKPAYLRRRITQTDATPRSESIISDMADGVTVLQHFFNFAHDAEAAFEHKETKLVLLIAGLCGDGGRAIEMFDEEIAEHARCTDRTIRQWRKDYLAKSRRLNFFPLEINEGEYDVERKRYAKTSYAIHPDTAEAIKRAVAEARAMPDYDRDRLKALEHAASEHYDEIPNAPPKGRTRKPKKSLRSPAIQNINNASNNLTKGKQSLDEMPPRMRAALLAGEGDSLRATLKEMQAKIDQLLSAISEDTETKDVSYMPEISSGIPLEVSEGRGRDGNSGCRRRKSLPRKRKRFAEGT